MGDDPHFSIVLPGIYFHTCTLGHRLSITQIQTREGWQCLAYAI